MNSHTCRLCNRSFTNGRALGGHMRSHAIPQPKPTPLSHSDIEFSSSAVQYICESDAESSMNPLHSKFTAFSDEQMSSVSDVSSDEDVARCLMLLSRDSWSNDYQPINEDCTDDDDHDDYDEERVLVAKVRRKRTGFSCETCRKVFRTYQGLCGHRTSHKHVGVECVPTVKMFECPYCDRVFNSGQALGGHKRSHFGSSHCASVAGADKQVDVQGRMKCEIDLNLPAPLEEEGELSAAS